MSGIHHDVYPWKPYRPRDVVRLLGEISVPWYVAAGWAIDLFLGGERREHEDLEIAAPAAGFDEIVAALGGHDVFVVGPEPAIVRPLAEARDLLGETHQTWVLDPDAAAWRFDIFREPSAGDFWACRRDERIRLPYNEVIAHTADGIPYGRPEIVLLYKAKHERPKDDADFEAVLPRLQPDQRRWLAESLALIHPGHRWLPGLK